MKITHLNSSTQIIEFDNLKILTDPWLISGIYYGSWAIIPEIIVDWDYLNNNIDYIWISHIHPDHSCMKTLEKLNKNIPILIHNFKSKFLKNYLERLTFKVIEIEHGIPYYLNDKVFIDIYSADNYDPNLCQKFFGCGLYEVSFANTQIDSLSVISDGNHTLVNTNDCPYELAENVIDIIKKKYKNIDILELGYAGAGPYPQCFYFEEEKLQQEAVVDKYNSFLQRNFNYIKKLSPKYFFPFAGTYVLQGKLHKLNSLRGVPSIDEALLALQQLSNDNNINTVGFLLNSYSTFDVSNGHSSEPYTKINETKIEQDINALAHIKYSYEEDEIPSKSEIDNLFALSSKRFFDKCLFHKLNTSELLVISYYSGEFTWSNNYPHIVFDCANYKYYDAKLSDILLSKQYSIIYVDIRLLKKILMGPKYAHWNNAEIGSHLFYRRNTEYNRALYFCLNYLHT